MQSSTEVPTGMVSMAWPESATPQIPFDDLKVVHRVRCGGFGAVYRARLGRQTVALKVLSVDEKDATDLFVQEATVLRMVDHR